MMSKLFHSETCQSSRKTNTTFVSTQNVAEFTSELNLNKIAIQILCFNHTHFENGLRDF